MRSPDFIVIGAQKSASTFVQACLADHPDIYMPKGETPYFESPDYEESEKPVWRALFEGQKEQFLGIKRPNYLGKSEVPSRIVADLPECRLIAVLRNPVERIVSAYFHQIKYGTLPAVPIEEGLAEILDGGPLAQRYPRSRELVEFGLYAKHLAAYGHFRENGRLLCLLHDDIAKDPLAEIQKCYAFIGADPSFVPPSLHSRPQKVTYSIPRLRFLGLRNRFLHEYNADRTRLKARTMNPGRWLAVAAITAVDRYLLSWRASEKPKLSLDLRSRLEVLYRQDAAVLQEMIDRDLSHWFIMEPMV